MFCTSLEYPNLVNRLQKTLTESSLFNEYLKLKELKQIAAGGK